MKAIEQYFHVVLFIMLYKVVLILKSVNETLVCDHFNESYWAVLSCGTVYYAQGGPNIYNVALTRKSVSVGKVKERRIFSSVSNLIYH